jgi:hypothetical protein
VRRDQTVSEMAKEVLARQAEALAGRTGQPFESALEAVAGTEAGRQLEELANGEHGHERAMDWQANLVRERAGERHYSWVEGYMEWLEGKEARVEYHAFLEKELVRLKG